MTMTTNSQTHNRGVLNRAFIKVIEDATAAVAETFTVGFTPKFIRVENATDRIGYEWYQGMADNTAIKTVAAGTRTLDTTEGPAISGYGFIMPAAAMIASKTFYIVVEG